MTVCFESLDVFYLQTITSVPGDGSLDLNQCKKSMKNYFKWPQGSHFDFNKAVLVTSLKHKPWKEPTDTSNALTFWSI